MSTVRTTSSVPRRDSREILMHSEWRLFPVEKRGLYSVVCCSQCLKDAIALVDATSVSTNKRGLLVRIWSQKTAVVLASEGSELLEHQVPTGGT